MQWYAKYAIPLLKKTFSTQEIMFDNDTIANTFEQDSMIVGDTIHITYCDTFIDTQRTVLFDQQDISFHTGLYKFRTQALPGLVCSLSVPDTFFSDTLLVSPVPVMLNDSTSVKYFKYLVFDSSSETIPIRIKNISPATVFRNLYAQIISYDTIIITIDTIPQLNPMDTAIRIVSLSRKTIGNTFTVIVCAEISAGSIINESTGLVFGIDLNSQEIEKAVINDCFLDFSFEGSFCFPLTDDTFDLSYIDISKINIPMMIENGTPIEVLLQPSVSSVFDIDYCKKEQITSLAELEGKVIDSTFFLGNAFPPLVIKGTDNSLNPVESEIKIALDNARFLPAWDSLECRSYLTVGVKGRIQQKNQEIIIEKSIPLGFSLKKPEINFEEIKGLYRQRKLVPGDLSKFNIPLENASEIFKILRHRFKLVRNEINFTIAFPITDNTTISVMDYTCVFPQLNDETGTVDTLNWEIRDIKKGASYNISCSLDSIINSFPDSLGYVLDIAFPVNETIVFGNETFINSPNFSYLELTANACLRMSFFLVWEISDTIRLPLENLKTALSFNPVVVSGLENMSLTIQGVVFNQTNLKGRIFGLGATKRYTGQLLALSTDEISPQILSTEKGKHFIPILGNSGLILPQRNASISNTINLSELNVHHLVNSDSLLVRWELLLPPTNADALTDTDYISLDANMVLEGIQTTGGIGTVSLQAIHP